jgi:hypothetical protein
MNGNDVLRYGHLTLLATLDALPAGHGESPGVCGFWSAKDVVAHLASYELALVDLLEAFVAGRQREFVSPIDEAFNDEQVARRRHLSMAEARDEYERAYGRVGDLIRQVPAEQRRRAGELPWYGAEYDLEDYLVYAFYGHKREHSAQIAAFCDTLRPTS